MCQLRSFCLASGSCGFGGRAGAGACVCCESGDDTQRLGPENKRVTHPTAAEKGVPGVPGVPIHHFIQSLPIRVCRMRVRSIRFLDQ